MSTYNLIQDGESGLLVRQTLNQVIESANSGFTSVYYQQNVNTFPSSGKTGDVLLITNDGTSGGTVSEEWIYNGGDWTAVFTGLTSNLYLPLTGGTVTGNLSVTGTTDVNSLSATTLNLSTIGSGTSVTNLGIDVSGNVVSGVTTSTSGNFLPLSGGTVTGNTIFTSGLTASTTTVNGNLTVTGTTSVASLTASTATVNGNLRVTGTTNTGALTASTLNLTTIGSGTSITNLGIDVSGNVVSGTTTTEALYQAFTGITQGRAVRLGENGRIYPMDFVGVENQPIIGIAQTSGSTNSFVKVILEGGLSTATAGLTPSYNYYASANGSLSLTGETYVGTAVSSGTLQVWFGSPNGVVTPSLSIIDNTITDPANVTVPGRYIVPVSGLTGSFVGNQNDYADYNGVDFTFTLPTNNDKAVITTGPNAGNVYLFTSGATSGWTLSSQSTTLPTSNWSSGVAYKQFDLVIYQNFLYQANGNIPANTAFNVGTSGATWKPINNGVVAEFGNATVNAANGAALSTSVPTILLTFNIPSAGVWELVSTITLNSANGTSTWAYYDSSGTIVPNTTTTGPFEASGNLIRATTRAVQVTTTGPTTYTVRGLASITTTFVNNSTNGFSTGIYNKISGFAPVVGQVSQYRSATLYATLNGSGSATPVDFTGTTISVGTIPLTTNGIWTLTAGVTYEIFASITYDAGGTNQLQGDTFSVFVDATTNVPLANQFGISTITPFFTGRGLMRNGVGTFEYTPSTNQTIKLRVTFQNNIGDLTAQTNIKQLGTTNTSAFTGVITPSWNISNTYPLGTMVVNSGVLYQANSLVPAGTSFTIGTTGATWRQIGGITASGGTTNQVLIKNSNTNFDTTWVNYIPTGGTNNQILLKTGSTDYATAWFNYIPTGGTQGQILIKNSSTNYDTVWTGSTPTLVQAQNNSGQSIGHNVANPSITVTGWTNTYTQNAAEWNATTGVFTATKAGTYLVSSNLTYSDKASGIVGNVVNVQVVKNTTAQAVSTMAAESTAVTLKGTGTVTAIVNVAAGDTISIRTYHNLGSAANLITTVALNNVTIQEISARIID